jgi:CheY-like chemotaxis protein
MIGKVDPKLILLVDDDIDYLEVNRTVLESAGYGVQCCDDTQQALAAIESRRPDLIVSDLMMRSLYEGFAFAKVLRGDPSTARVPIIMTTGIKRQMGVSFKPTEQGDLAAMGVDAYLEKPVRAPALLAKVKELIGEP